MILKTQNVESLKGKDVIILECEYCHKDFESTKAKYLRTFYADTKLRFCSHDCATLSKDTKQEYSCTVCGKIVRRNVSQLRKSKNIFCSQSCAAKHNNLGVAHNPKKKRANCRACGKPVKKGRVFCGETCEKDEMQKSWTDEILKSDKTVGEFRLTGGFRQNHNSKIRRVARKIYKYSNPEMKCEHCGYNKIIEVCHKKPIASFGNDVLLSEVNSPENLIGLCPNCHWEFDNGLLKI